MKVKSLGIDLRGCNPTLGNIKGGLSTIEEKSLGAIVKSGSSKIKDVLKYGEKPAGNGLYMMMSPGREIEFLTGLIAGGAQTVLFSTGIGAPQGYPIAPVIKICGNPKTCSTLYEHIDVDVSEIITKGISIDEASERILEKIIRVASGEKTKAELIGYDRTVDIYIRGMVL
jgi:altronate dehydratase large subunit